MNDEGYVYFIKAHGMNRVKIGFTRGPFSVRKDGIQTMSPVELERLGVLKVRGASPRKIEQELHEAFDAYRIWGEWFEFPSSEMSCLKKCFRRGKDRPFDYQTFKEYWKRTNGFSGDKLALRQPGHWVRRYERMKDNSWL